MPRKNLSPRKARAELLALKLEKARYEIRALRRAERECEAALALRRSTPDWVDMNRQLKRLQLEAEMNAMEDCLEAGRPQFPVLNFDHTPKRERSRVNKPPTPAPAVHPDVLVQAALSAGLAIVDDEDRRAPPDGEAWKYPGTLEGRHPADDYRNYE